MLQMKYNGTIEASTLRLKTALTATLKNLKAVRKIHTIQYTKQLCKFNEIAETNLIECSNEESEEKSTIKILSMPLIVSESLTLLYGWL